MFFMLLLHTWALHVIASAGLCFFKVLKHTKRLSLLPQLLRQRRVFICYIFYLKLFKLRQPAAVGFDQVIAKRRDVVQ